MNEDPTAVGKSQYTPYASGQELIRLKCFNLNPGLRSKTTTQNTTKKKVVHGAGEFLTLKDQSEYLKQAHTERSFHHEENQHRYSH